MNYGANANNCPIKEFDDFKVTDFMKTVNNPLTIKNKEI